MLFVRYGANFEYISNLPYEDGYSFIEYAIEQDREEKIYNTWLHGYNFQMDFEEFKNGITCNKTSNDVRDNDTNLSDILSNVADICNTKTQRLGGES